MLTDYKNSFADSLIHRFAINSYLYISPHLRYVATYYLVKYECQEMSGMGMSGKWRQSEICIVINDKSQGSIAKHLSWDGLFHCK